ncbi:hemoglobin/transferrin/lactoferrin receptor protein [Volucribacter psittacicida]|uniref:Hemoglobin/transferrin/lactoferrin receptor protein n=1 Tax=Volucribacter psittacicida TaxID=203482 RepID=A0A4R1G5E5_9PAST|nr:TonB-dependent receptor [Volucribacter psittacicida]TCK01690.1 hemoglobin/transferrin/lactoferrin receptor protein [Volucribacter psittacicida]
MIRKSIIATTVIASFISPYTLAEDILVLDDINISGQITHNKADQAFSQAGGVVIREADERMQSLDSVVRSLPGVYSNIDPAQGTVNVNIRGMSGLGRVNTTVDGVPQTFFGTSSNGNRRFHDEEGGLAPSSQYGVMIDPNFFTEIRVDKGFVTGANAVNALAGSVSYRTFEVDDIVFPGNQVGVRSRFGYGTNKLGYNGMLAVGGKTTAFTDSGSIGAFFAYSQRDIGANYKRGDGRYAIENGYVKKMDQKPKSWLSKLEIKPNQQHRILFSGRSYVTNIGGRELDSKSYSLNYDYKPESNWIDIELLASHTVNKQGYNDDSSLWQLTDASTSNKSDYLDLHNTSYLKWLNSDWQWTVGLSYFNNDYARQAKGINDDNLAYTPFSPSGKQRIYSAYSNLNWNKDIYDIDLGLVYSRSNFTGFKPACGITGGQLIPCIPMGAYNMDVTHYSLDPSIMFSLKLSDWFSPFVSYSRSTRMPNIQEIFFNNEEGASMNVGLRPEVANIYQLGFNTFKKNWLFDQDQLGLKLLYYRSYTKNYISSSSVYLDRNGFFTTDPDLAYNPNFHAQMSFNSPNSLRTNGIELEASYDMGRAFARLSYSYEKTSHPLSVQSTVNGFGYGDIYELPKHYATLDLGARFLQQKLMVGTLLKYTGKAKRLSPRGVNTDTGEIEKQTLPSQPMIVDAYLTYQFNKHFMLKASIQNVFNVLYIDPLNSQNSTPSQYVSDGNGGDGYTYTNYARGRSYLIGGEIRF